MKTFLSGVIASACLLAVGAARADAVETLRDFSRATTSGKAEFTQTVTSPDGARKKSSSGVFEFSRPDRFRFAYTKPFEQLIVSDGSKVWLHDPDLNQVSVRPMSQALGATPVALLAGGAIEKDFELSPQASSDGMEWVQAKPRQKEGNTVQSLRVGFRGKVLAALEIVDAFGQRSMLNFSNVTANPRIAEERFRFVPPKGADVIQQ
jgi:outer membrane lipoprotein carrier protein